MTKLRTITSQNLEQAKKDFATYQQAVEGANKEKSKHHEILQTIADQIVALETLNAVADEAKEPSAQELLTAVTQTRHSIQSAVREALKANPEKKFKEQSEESLSQPLFAFIDLLVQEEGLLAGLTPQVEDLENTVKHLTNAKNELASQVETLNIKISELKTALQEAVEKEQQANTRLKEQEEKTNEELDKLRKRVAEIDEEESAVVDLSIEANITRTSPKNVIFTKYQEILNAYHDQDKLVKELTLAKKELEDKLLLVPADVENNPHYRNEALAQGRRATAFENEKNRLAATNATLLHEIEVLKEQLAALNNMLEERINEGVSAKMVEHHVALNEAKQAGVDKDSEIEKLKLQIQNQANEANEFAVPEMGTPRTKAIAAVVETAQSNAEDAQLIPSTSTPANSTPSSVSPNRGWIGWMLVTFADLVLTSVSILSYVGLSTLMASNPFTLGVAIGTGIAALFLGKKTYDQIPASKPAVKVTSTENTTQAAAATATETTEQTAEKENAFVPSIVNAANNSNTPVVEHEVSVASKTVVSASHDSDSLYDASSTENSVSSKNDDANPVESENDNVHSFAAHLKSKSSGADKDKQATETTVLVETQVETEVQKEGEVNRKSVKEGTIDVAVVNAPKKLSKEMFLNDVAPGSASLIGKLKDSPTNKGKVEADQVAAANLLTTNTAPAQTKQGNCTIM